MSHIWYRAFQPWCIHGQKNEGNVNFRDIKAMKSVDRIVRPIPNEYLNLLVVQNHFVMRLEFELLMQKRLLDRILERCKDVLFCAFLDIFRVILEGNG
jgi:hypothetical protein